MEPLSAALTFSTIVGLIGQYRSEKGGQSQSDFNDFLVWLSKTQHEDIREQLEKNHQAVGAVKLLLEQQQDALMDRLDSIDSLLVSVASAFSDFRELGVALRPSSVLSSNAISILRQFDASGGGKLLESQTYGGTRLMLLDVQGMIEVEDQRYLEDDLRTLVELNLLRQDLNPRGENIYILTRKASELVQGLNS